MGFRAMLYSMKARLKILFCAAEWPSWGRARNYSYCSQLGLERALHRAGVDVLYIPATWLRRAREIVGSRRFDQVWVEVVHSPEAPGLDVDLLEWAASLAPVSFAYVSENLTYTEADERSLPDVRGRRDRVMARLKHYTHAGVVDESDVAEVEASCGIPAFWWLPAVPERSVRRNPEPPRAPFATFIGGIYGDRLQWLERKELKGLLRRLSSPEEDTILPLLFEALHETLDDFFKGGAPSRRLWMPRFLPFLGRWRLKRLSVSYSGLQPEDDLRSYLHVLRQLRRQSFALYLRAMRTGNAVVNLPHAARTYSSRVVEGMAAGVPVVSFRIPDRPRIAALFAPDEEILLFDGNRPEELAEQLQRLRSDVNLARRLARNAASKVLVDHTTDVRVRQVLDWLEATPAR